MEKGFNNKIIIPITLYKTDFNKRIQKLYTTKIIIFK
jgi:hypothetical protein